MNNIILDNRQLCDLELILNGGFNPLKGFLNQNDYNSVLENMRLSTGELWPMPIVLSITNEEKNKLLDKKSVLLCDKTNLPIAELLIEDIYKPDLVKECKSVFGCDDDNHPYIKKILKQEDNYYIGGTVKKIRLPLHFMILVTLD